MPGYIYVLIHPSDPNLFKVGVSVHHPKRRLAVHNRDFTKAAGRVVEATGQKWELKEYHEVADPYWAESAFWGATGIADIPFRRGVEVERMQWKTVEVGLNAAKKAGRRPAPTEKPVPDYVYAYRAWMNKRLAGRDITLVGHVRSKYGKSNFQCSNGHQWRTVPIEVAKGAGCPTCGIGEGDEEEIERATNSGSLCLLVHPDKPGLIKVRTYRIRERDRGEQGWDGWEVHRGRSVEDPDQALSIFSRLLGVPEIVESESIQIDLKVAEQAIRDLHYEIVKETASAERARGGA